MDFEHNFQNVSNMLGWDKVMDVTTLTSLIQRMLNEGKITEKDCSKFLVAEISAHIDAGNRVKCSDCEESVEVLYIDSNDDQSSLNPVCANCALEGEASRIESDPSKNKRRMWTRNSSR